MRSAHLHSQKTVGRRLARMLVVALSAFACAVVSPLPGTIGPADAAEILRFGFILPQHSQLGAGAAVFAAEIAQRTGGRFRIDLYPDAMLGGEVEMMKSVQLGTIDLAFITGAATATMVPDIGVFQIPYLFKDVANARAVLDGPIGEDYLRRFEAKGLVALAWGENGLRHITTASTPVRTPADLKGLRLRIPQSDTFAIGFEALGANVRQLPFPDVYGALRSGRIAAQENPIATIIASHFAEVQKHLSLTGHIYDPAVILMSRDAFDALSPADRMVFRAAAKLAAAASRDAAAADARTGLAALRAAGMIVTEDVDRAAFARKVSDADARFAEWFGREAIDRIKAYQSRAVAEPISASARTELTR